MMTVLPLMLVLAALEPVQIAPDAILVVRVNRDDSTLLSNLSHNHAIRATEYQITAALDAESGRCTLDIAVPVASLEVDAPAMRRKYGLEGELDEDDRAEIKENMLDEDQLHASKYPILTLNSGTCRLDEEALTLEGTLAIRGRSKTVRLELERSPGKGGTVRLAGKLPIKGTDFGFEPYSAALGSLKNLDAMTIHIELSARLPPE